MPSRIPHRIWLLASTLVVAVAVMLWLVAGRGQGGGSDAQTSPDLHSRAAGTSPQTPGDSDNAAASSVPVTPAAAHSAVPSAAQNATAALYNAASVAELMAKASAFDAHDPDAFAIVGNAERFCGFARHILSPSSDGKPRVADTQEARRSVQLVTDFVATFCNGPMPNADGQGLAHEIQDKLIAGTKDADYRRVLEIEAGYRSANMTDTERADAMTELAEIMARTQSPEVLSAAGNALASGRFGDWALGRDLVAWTPFEGRMLELQSAAVVLAQCRLARSCGPNTLTIMQMCVPAMCTPGMSAEDYLRRILSADEFDIVLRMHAEIERARHAGG